MQFDCWKIIQIVFGSGVAITLIAGLIQLGRVLERLDRVESVAIRIEQKRVTDDAVTRSEYMALWRIHYLAGEIE